MSLSFLMVCLMKDITMIVNHKLILDSMSFLFARIVCFSSILVCKSWNLLFCGIYRKQESQENIVQLPLLFLAFLLYHIFSVELVHAPLSVSQSFEYLCRRCFDPNQRENQIKCMLCKDDNRPKALYIYLLTSILKGLPAPESRFLSFLFDRRCSS